MQNLDLWDSADFEDTVAHDRELGSQVLAEFESQTSGFLKKVPSLTAAGDFAELHRIAHTLKGSSAAISAKKLYAWADELSTATKEQNAQNVLKATANFTADFENFLQLAKNWTSQC